MRSTALLTAVLLAASCAGGVPAHATKMTLGANTGYGGTIISKNAPGTRASGPVANDVSASCSYAAVVTPSNSLTITVAAKAEAYGPGVAVATSVRCVVRNTDSGGSLSSAVSSGLPGPAAVAVGVVSNWPVLPLVTVCVEASAIFASGQFATLSFSCIQPTGLTAACTFSATPVRLSQGLYYPVVAMRSNVLGLPFTVGACTVDFTFFFASCGNSHGAGTVNGRPFALDEVGGVIRFTGALVGAVTAVPDVPGGESCAGGAGADTFLWTGVALRA